MNGEKISGERKAKQGWHKFFYFFSKRSYYGACAEKFT